MWWLVNIGSGNELVHSAITCPNVDPATYCIGCHLAATKSDPAVHGLHKRDADYLVTNCVKASYGTNKESRPH